MRKLILYSILLFALSNLAYAVIVETGTVFDDGFYTYPANTDFTVDDIKVDDGEIYFDNIPFCEWGGKSQLTTTRDCEEEPTPAPEFSTITVILALTLIVLTFMIISSMEYFREAKKWYK